MNRRHGNRLVSAVGAPGVEIIACWEDFNGRRSRWPILVHDVSRLDGAELLVLASHCNSLIQDWSGVERMEVQPKVVRGFASQEQWTSLLAVATKAGSFPAVFCRQSLLMLCRLAIEHGRWDGEGRPAAPALLDLVLRVNDHITPPATLPQKRARNEFAEKYAIAPFFLFQTDFAGTPYLLTAIARTLRMIGEIHHRLKSADPGAIDVRALFQAGTGVDVDRYLAMTLGLGLLTTPAWAKEDGEGEQFELEQVDRFTLTQANLKGAGSLPADMVDAFFNAVSDTPARFIPKFKDDLPVQVCFTAFKSKPVAEIRPGCYRVIDKSFLMTKLSNGVYWAALERFISDQSGARLDAVKRFGGWWGRLHEHHLHDVFTNSTLTGKYEAEPRLKAAPSVGCDGLFREGDAVILLEYKASLLPLKGRNATSAIKQAAAFLKVFAAGRGQGTGARRGARGVPQLAAVVRGILSGDAIGSHGCVDLERTKVYPVLVCLDRVAGAPMVNCLLQKRFFSEVSSEAPTSVRPLVVLTTELLERLITRVPGVRLADALEEYLTSPAGDIGGPQWAILPKFFPEKGEYSNPYLEQMSHDWFATAALNWRENPVTEPSRGDVATTSSSELRRL